MPLKFAKTEHCKEDDCRGIQPMNRTPQYRYEAPTTCHYCHSWHDEFHTVLERVEVRIGFRHNGGWEEPGKFD